MAESPERFATLLDQAADGSASAAAQLIEQYTPYLRFMVRRYLHQSMRSQYDTQDFEQDVWKSFFAAYCNKEAFEHPNQLIALLQVMARNKVIDAARRHRKCRTARGPAADLRDEDWQSIGENHELEDCKPQSRPAALEKTGPVPTEKIPSADPTPSKIVMAEEEWKVFLQQLPAEDQPIFILLRAGLNPVMISDRLGINRRNVYRRIIRVLNRHCPATDNQRV